MIKAQTTKKNYQNKKFYGSKTNQESERQPTNGTKYLQITYLIRDFYLEYIKNYYKSIIDK